MGYMVNLTVAGKAAVVIGAGGIAARKVQDLLAAQARVTVVATRASSSIVAMAEEGRLTLYLRAYRKEDLEGAFLAVVATDDEDLNRQVAADAAALNLLINVVDRPALCSFTVPATLSRGDLTIAVATEGRCPALSSILREELQQQFGPEYAELVELFGALRDRMMAQSRDGQQIRAALSSIYRGGVMDRIRSGDRQLVEELVAAHVALT